MVLLNASTISVAISSGIVCTFTFLLFLSGYVLQQQTVKSLQEALAAPLEVRVKVNPSLSPQFQDLENETLEAVEDDDNQLVSVTQVSRSNEDVVQIVIASSESSRDTTSEPSPQELWHTYVDSFTPDATLNDFKPPKTPSVILEDAILGRFAYILSLPTTKDLCSALLFTAWYRQFSRTSPDINVNIIYLYPSDWETSSHASHISALRLLLHSEHTHSVLLHPVPISKVWTGIDIESQLLSELARNPWPYDRFIYLRTPGMLLDTARLDHALLSSYTEPQTLKTSWAKLRPPSRRTGPANLHPDVLLFAQGRGLMIPQGRLAKTLTVQAPTWDEADDTTIHGNGRGEVPVKEAAYVLFDEEELELRRQNRPDSSGIFERFERERSAVCEGTGLLAR